MGGKNKAHKNFWIYVIIGASLVFGMIYVSSMAQQKEEMQSQNLENQLTEHKNQTKGIEASVQKITKENTRLKDELEEKSAELEDVLANMETLQDLTALSKSFAERDYEECKVIISRIDTKLLDEDNLWLYNFISAEITKIKE